MKCLLPILLCISTGLFAQDPAYYIRFTDKNCSDFSTGHPEAFLSPKAISRREKYNIPIRVKDLPVSSIYLDSLRLTGATVKLVTKWGNGVVATANESQVQQISQLPFVRSVNILPKRKSPRSAAICQSENLAVYGNSATQNKMIGIDDMHLAGFNGSGITIAVMDAGFSNADNLPVFDALFLNNRIISTYDFVAGDSMVYEDHNHGTNVLSALAGFAPGEVIGPAYGAGFHLFRTEDVSSETLQEEINWMVAAEKADSLGVDIISSSLGYTQFDNPSENHTYQDMNGDSTIVTRAADYAASVGILVVTSAGNEGSSSWKKIVSPADGDSVLAVGAVDFNKNYVSFSSKGPSYDGRIKPNVAAMGQSVRAANGNGSYSNVSGTSLSCPLIAGLCAGLWQEFPGYNNMDIINAVQLSGTQAANPDSLLGYGVPFYTWARTVLSTEETIATKALSISPNPAITVITLNIDKATPVKLFNAVGEEVNIPMHDATQIDVSRLPGGLYLLKAPGYKTCTFLKI